MSLHDHDLLFESNKRQVEAEIRPVAADVKPHLAAWDLRVVAAMRT